MCFVISYFCDHKDRFFGVTKFKKRMSGKLQKNKGLFDQSACFKLPPALLIFLHFLPISKRQSFLSCRHS